MSAEMCRKNGWGVGQHLMGNEGYGPEVIRITAIGEEEILARLVFSRGKPVSRSEATWTLIFRDWKAVPSACPPTT